MSIAPAFELGLWNAWVFTLYVISSNVLPYVLSGKLIDSEVWKKATGADMQLNETEKKISKIISFLFYALIAYSFFIPLKLGTIWLYVGLLVYLLGVIIETTAMLNFLTTPVNKPVIKGVYRVSRNPVYLGMFLMFIGISVACASWVFLLATVALVILIHVSLVSEERWGSERYGDTYREYMKRIPRWIGIPKPEKKA
jgi:protein-S-isoprenylcysteine O-methyltransferase Ste14